MTVEVCESVEARRFEHGPTIASGSLMRTGIIGCVALARIASASAEPETTPLGYAQVGLQLASVKGDGFVSARIDGGYHLGGTPLWLHAAAARGNPINFSLGGDLGDEHSVSGSLSELAVGIEARTCRNAVFCGALGLDAGYETVLYDDNDATDPRQSIHFEHGGVVAIPRIELDVGGDHVRVRPTLSWPLGSNFSGPRITIALAYQF